MSANAAVDPSAVYTVNLSSAAELNGWTVTWGDGSTSSLPGNASSATHTYTGTPEQYTVTATATDEASATGMATFAVLVLPSLPHCPRSIRRRAGRRRSDGRPRSRRRRDAGRPAVAGASRHDFDLGPRLR